MPEPENEVRRALLEYLATKSYGPFVRKVSQELWRCPEQVYMLDSSELLMVWDLCMRRRELASRMLRIVQSRRQPAISFAKDEYRLRWCKRRASDIC